jgi:hypothetical protein
MATKAELLAEIHDLRDQLATMRAERDAAWAKVGAMEAQAARLVPIVDAVTARLAQADMALANYGRQPVEPPATPEVSPDVAAFVASVWDGHSLVLPAKLTPPGQRARHHG